MDVTTIFTTLENIVGGFIGLLGSLFDGTTGIPSLFWNETTGLTLIGVLGLMAFGYGMVRFVFGYVRKLISLKGAN